MKPPIYVRPLSGEEEGQLTAGLRSQNAFTLRRCQILFASARHQTPTVIAANLGCASQTVRNTIRAFEQQGLACLTAQSNRPKTVQPTFNALKREALREMLHKSPRSYGKATRVWTLKLAAQVSVETGLTPTQLSIETIRTALQQLGVSWQRAKTWITSPDPAYATKKNGATRSSRGR